MNPNPPVVLSCAPHERQAVERLVRFCHELDGTSIFLFTLPEPEGMVYPEVANHCFHEVASQYQGKPFIWIEADCVPLKPGWAQALTDEYYRQGKEYLYPLQFNPPHDVFAGIVVQGPNAYEHAPVGEKRVNFDKRDVTEPKEWEAQMGQALTGLLREVDPSIDPKHVAHLSDLEDKPSEESNVLP